MKDPYQTVEASVVGELKNKMENLFTWIRQTDTNNLKVLEEQANIMDELYLIKSVLDDPYQKYESLIEEQEKRLEKIEQRKHYIKSVLENSEE